MSVRTRRCSCCALQERNHHHHCGPLPTRLLASRTQPVPAITTMGRTAALLFSPPSSAVALQLPMALFLPPARQRSVMPRDTTAQMGEVQPVPAHKQSHVCVCVHAAQLLHLHLASSTHHSSSRDQQTSLHLRRRHTHNAAPLPLVCGGESLAHCHPLQAPSDEALAPHTLPRTHPSFLP